MATHPVNKIDTETRTYTFDYTSALPSGVTVTSASANCYPRSTGTLDNDPIVGGASFTTTTASIQVLGNTTAGEVYMIIMATSLSNNDTWVDALEVRVEGIDV